MLPEIQENVSLASFSTMRLGGRTRYLAEARSNKDFKSLTKWAHQHNQPIIMIGEGSNIVWSDDGFEGLVIICRLKGKRIVSQNSKSVTIEIAAGEKWDEVVAWSVKQNWSGLEFLSLIPGYAGAAPVQNIGAYGGELSNCFVELEAYDTETRRFTKVARQNCGFGYRTSRFKTTDAHRFLISSLILKLSKAPPQPPFYEALERYFDEHKITDFTPLTIREAVMSIRPAKLPDPSQIANNGSFFTNPIVEKHVYEKLKVKYPEIKSWPHGQKFKLSAAWLVEQAGFKDYHDKETGMGTWPNQCLVLVNEHAKSSNDLLAFKNKIVKAVHDKFGIVLEQEPELLP